MVRFTQVFHDRSAALAQVRRLHRAGVAGLRLKTDYYSGPDTPATCFIVSWEVEGPLGRLGCGQVPGCGRVPEALRRA
jgi:hypothetical protein